MGYQFLNGMGRTLDIGAIAFKLSPIRQKYRVSQRQPSGDPGKLDSEAIRSDFATIIPPGLY